MVRCFKYFLFSKISITWEKLTETLEWDVTGQNNEEQDLIPESMYMRMFQKSVKISA